MLQEGTKAPDFSLNTVDGQTLTLSQACQNGHNVLLIFFRHLGWMHCRDHVVQVHHQKEQFEALDTRVWVIGFTKKRRARGWLKRADITFPFLLDPERQVYQTYEIERSILRSWSLRNLWSYVKAFFQGRQLQEIEEDPNQLGANFIVDKQGILRLAYYSQDPTDRPTVDELLKELRGFEQP